MERQALFDSKEVMPLHQFSLAFPSRPKMINSVEQDSIPSSAWLSFARVRREGVEGRIERPKILFDNSAQT